MRINAKNRHCSVVFPAHILSQTTERFHKKWNQFAARSPLNAAEAQKVTTLRAGWFSNPLSRNWPSQQNIKLRHINKSGENAPINLLCYSRYLLARAGVSGGADGSCCGPHPWASGFSYHGTVISVTVVINQFYCIILR